MYINKNKAETDYTCKALKPPKHNHGAARTQR